jgi:hypothetical protein
LLDGICKARIKKLYGKEIAEKFDLIRLFGRKINIENEIKKKFKESLQKESKEFLELAESKYPQENLLDTWLVEKKIRDIGFKITGDKQEKKRNESKYFRKYRYTAAVAICNDYVFDFPYGGFRAISFLSNGSVREFLRILSSIIKATGLELEELVKEKKPIKIKEQRKGVINAANEFFKEISEQMGSLGPEVSRLCDSLGNLFKKCQSYPGMIAAPETASISLDYNSLSKEIKVLIHEAISFGAIELICKRKRLQNKYYIGLQPTLAPKYGISFRSINYYPQSMNHRAFEELISTQNTGLREKIIDCIVKQRSKKGKEIGEKFETTDGKQRKLFQL